MRYVDSLMHNQVISLTSHRMPKSKDSRDSIVLFRSKGRVIAEYSHWPIIITNDQCRFPNATRVSVGVSFKCRLIRLTPPNTRHVSFITVTANCPNRSQRAIDSEQRARRPSNSTGRRVTSNVTLARRARVGRQGIMIPVSRLPPLGRLG